MGKAAQVLKNPKEKSVAWAPQSSRAGLGPTTPRCLAAQLLAVLLLTKEISIGDGKKLTQQ